MSPIFSRPSESFSQSGTALYSSAAALTRRVAVAIAVRVRMACFMVRTVYALQRARRGCMSAGAGRPMHFPREPAYHKRSWKTAEMDHDVHAALGAHAQDS